MSFSTNPIPCAYPPALPAWKALESKASMAKTKTLKDYFLNSPARAHTLKYRLASLSIDISRHHIDKGIIDALFTLAEESGLSEAISTLFSGKSVNHTEGRPALHMTLRGPFGPEQLIDSVNHCHEKMAHICNKLQSQQWLGHTGKPIDTIINIGIGGSDLGPRCVYEALRPYHNPILNLKFVANIDPADLAEALKNSDPETSLFIIASKSFTTPETLTNALGARQWLQSSTAPGADISNHFIAITSRTDRAIAFGIDEANTLPMWDWVGGRFSLWSAIGLSIALATSFDVFKQLLEGACEVDRHFSQTPLKENIPALLALLEIWYVNFWGCQSVAVLPYDHHLRLLPDHLQQLTMESNGKSVRRDGSPIDYSTCPVLWGSAGTIGQHSFHQMLHQGTQMIPVDFILPLSSHEDNPGKHAHMVANCLAQAQTLMEGQQAEEVAIKLSQEGLDPSTVDVLTPHKLMPGNRPSTLITTPKLTPQSLGSLIALYEHKTFAASVILGINAFDQWGVELGKQAAESIYKALIDNGMSPKNPATAAGIDEYCQQHQHD